MVHHVQTAFRFAPLILLAALALPAADQPVIDYLPTKDAAIVDAQMPDARLLPGGIRFREQVAGKGPLIRKGDRVNALYIGRLINGEIFNQKRSRLHTFRFEVGAQPRQIIRGWEQAVLHMQEGGTYQVAIPSEFGYRDHGRPGQVPPHATLLFEIEILEVVRSKAGD
jgi:FKBP-type peptidyl-prolyl cis-trans isomerase